MPSTEPLTKTINKKRNFFLNFSMIPLFFWLDLDHVETSRWSEKEIEIALQGKLVVSVYVPMGDIFLENIVCFRN